MIGTFGELVFVVSDSKVLTLSGLNQSVSGQWSKHTIIGKKPKSEFQGANLRNLTFSITLDATLGVKPREQIEYLEGMIEAGLADYFIIGNKNLGSNPYIITSMSEAWDVIYNGGELARATLDITLEEYV